MYVYLILTLLILVFGFIQKRGEISTSNYCKLICLLFIVITGLRSPVVGSDTAVYAIGYSQLKDLSSIREAIGNHGDIGYYVFVWVLSRIGLPFWCLTLAVAIFFYCCITRFIRQYSTDPTLSFLFLMAFNFFQFSMTGIRQTIAFGFVLLALYEAFRPRGHLLKIILYIFIGCLFHNTCAISFLIVPMLMFKNRNTNGIILFSILVITIGFIFRGQMMNFMLSISADSRFTRYSEMDNQGAGFTTYLLYLIIYIVLIYNKASYIKKTGRGLFDFWLLVAAIFFQAMVLVQPVMFRLAWYFSIVLTIIIPQIINTLSVSNRRMANIVTYVGVLFMYFGITMGTATVLPYKFFWQ